MKKLFSVLLVLVAVATIVGCSLHSGHGHGPANAGLSSTLSGTVRDDGSLAEISFASGAKVNATAGTMQPNVVVTVTESKTSKIGANAIGTPSYIYIYIISAVLKSENGLTEDVLVSSLEQPITISLPTSYLGTNGICYVGIRFSEDEPWQYRVVSENGTIALNLRGKASSIPSECNIDLYRPNIQLALFVYDETTETASSTANIVVSEMTATSTPVINIVDEAYQEDLTVKLALEGINLSGLNASDLTARVTFRSSNATAMTLKSNGTNVTTTPASDKAVTGANYTHTFKVPSLTFENQLGTTAELSFVINTKDMAVVDFSKELLVELSGESDEVIGQTFVCTNYFAFATMTANATPISYSITYDLASGTLEGTNPASYDVTSATITLINPTRSGYAFLGWTGTGIATGTASETVIIPAGSTGDRSYVASWTLNNVLTFTLAEGVTLEMRRCPAGTFIMGSPSDEVGRSDNEATHTVTISENFYMGTYEVTQAQYMAIMGSNPSAHNTYGTGESEANLPVEKVSWNDIMTDSTGFIAKLNASLTAQLPTGYRFDLPTEAQWEYACRAGTTTSLNNGTNIVNANSEDSNLNAVGWYWENWGQSNSKTHTVGDKTPNAWGLYDMHGNVFEWCKDWYGNYPTTAVTDPAGPDTGSNRVMRGGSEDFSPCSCRSAYRNYNGPSIMNYDFGFRLALVLVH